MMAAATALLSALGGLLVPLLLGRQLVRALGGGELRAALGRGGEAAFGFGAGVTLVAVGLGVAYAARLPAPGLLVGAAALGAWAWLAWRARRRGRAATDAALAPSGVSLARPAQLVGAALITALAVAVAVASWRAAASFPDAHQVWLLRGKALYLDQGFGGACFQEWHSAHDRRAYPPLVSLATAWMHEVGRDADMRSAKLLSAAFYAALLLVAHGALRRLPARGASLALTLALGGCTTLVMLGIWGIADLPLAFHILCAGALLLGVDEPRALVRLLTLPVAGALLTKNEGLPAALAIGAACALRLACGGAAGRGRVLRALRGAGAVVVPGVLGLVAWWALATSLGLPLQFTKPVGGEPPAPDRLGNLVLVLRDMAGRAADPGMLAGWAVFGVVVVLLVAGARRPRAAGVRERCLAAAAIVVLTLAAYVWVLAGYRGDLPHLLRLTSGRLVAHLYPLALLVAAWSVSALAGARAPALTPPSAGSRSPPAPRGARPPSSP